MPYPMIHREFLLHRHPENPLIKPSDFPGGADGVRNCGTAMLGDETVCLATGKISEIVDACRKGL